MPGSPHGTPSQLPRNPALRPKPLPVQHSLCPSPVWAPKAHTKKYLSQGCLNCRNVSSPTSAALPGLAQKPPSAAILYFIAVCAIFFMVSVRKNSHTIHPSKCRIFITSKRNPIPLSQNPQIPKPYPHQSQATPHLLSVSRLPPFWTFHINGVTWKWSHYVTFVSSSLHVAQGFQSMLAATCMRTSFLGCLGGSVG